ncbi:hypothetical protein DCAR_0101036 [Daucus carota subsp. sativus]|uniref:Uncharacterized protein n=1 Tax=Daucus carota subsp. sativus TaxID=79200 RepID=A0A162B0M8_DAUCS|nr:hypothetical protein DCAR_0101036 [Daucus carota subsp. sativus]
MEIFKHFTPQHILSILSSRLRNSQKNQFSHKSVSTSFFFGPTSSDFSSNNFQPKKATPYPDKLIEVT